MTDQWLARRVMNDYRVISTYSQPSNVIAVLRTLADYELWKQRGPFSKETDILEACRFMHAIADSIEQMPHEHQWRGVVDGTTYCINCGVEKDG